jgi:hypothetical protein
MIIINQLVDCLKYVHTLENLVWEDDTINDNDMTILKKEAYDNSPFDTLKLKQNIFENHTKKIVKKTSSARVVIMGYDDQIFPWATWGRIFQAMGTPKDSEFWQIYIYASKQNRILPENPPLGPEHVNGGYTYPCSSKAVIIYRYEEVTRVLIHELLHASCTDNISLPVEVREASTETWAELFLIAILSKGSIQKAKRLWKIQEAYILDLHYTLQTFYSIHKPSDYVARYTIMRTPVFNQYNIYFSKSYTPKRISISRFTSPDLDKYIL